MKTTYFLILGLMILTFGLGYNFIKQPFAERFEQPAQPEASTQPVVVDPAEQIFQRLSAEQRIAQLFFVPITINESQTEILLEAATTSGELVSPEKTITLGGEVVGGVTIFGDGIASGSAKARISELQAEASRLSRNNQLQLLIAVDHEGGTVQRLSGEGYTVLPSWQAFCDLDEARRAAALRATTTELASTGIDIVFAPVVDVSQTNNALGSRICSGNAEEVISIASQAIIAYQQAGILPVIKHFPGIGKVVPDLHTTFARVTITGEDAAVYRDILSSFPKIGVMTTHVGVTNQFADIPCSLSSNCVSELKVTFPQTLVFTDALDMDSAGYKAGTDENSDPAQLKPLHQRSVEAVAAGNHVLVYGRGVDHQELEASYQVILDRYQTDTAFKSTVDSSVKKILTYKIAQGVKSE